MRVTAQCGIERPTFWLRAHVPREAGWSVWAKTRPLTTVDIDVVREKGR